MLTLMIAFIPPAAANPATPPPSVSAWDNRASSVTVATDVYPFADGSMRFLSLGANFSTANSHLASEFAAHFVTVDAEDGLTGGAISLTNVVTLGLAGRLADGRSRLSIAPYAGPQPTVLIGDSLPRVAIPFTMGLGLPIAASRAVLIVPWGEVAPALTVEPVLHPDNVSVPIDELVAGGTLTEDDLRRMFRQGVTYAPGFATGGRAGLTVSFHSRSVLFEVRGGVTSVGWTTTPHLAANVGASLGFHWEDPDAAAPCVEAPVVVPVVAPTPIPTPVPTPIQAPVPTRMPDPGPVEPAPPVEETTPPPLPAEPEP